MSEIPEEKKVIHMEKFIPVVVIKELSETDKILTALNHNKINCAESTFRTSCAAEAMLFDEESYCFSKSYHIHIVDRVGGGDSFGAGLIYSILSGKSTQAAIEFAVAASALKHS